MNEVNFKIIERYLYCQVAVLTRGPERHIAKGFTSFEAIVEQPRRYKLKVF